MKIKMWCLVNKKKGHIIQIGINDNTFVVGFATKKGLLSYVDSIDYDEEIKRIGVTI